MAHPPLFSFHSQRLRIGLLLMTGLFTTVSMRLDLSMAVTCMVNSTAYEKPVTNASSYLTSSSSSQCSQANAGRDLASLGNTSLVTFYASFTFLVHFLWRDCYNSYIGFAKEAGITVAGYLADRLGPKMILLGAALDYCLVSFLTPFISTRSYVLFFISRIVMGFGEGFFIPAMNSMASKWFPPTERSTIGALYTSGNQLAASLSSLISASLCASSLGWPSIFYLYGSLGIVWVVAWFFLSSSYPSENKWISDEEKEYLRTVVTQTKHQSKHHVPWKKLATSKVVLSIFMCNFSYNFSATILQAFLPTYFKDALFVDIKNNGLYTMIPFVTQLISKNICGVTADFLKRRKIISHTLSVKIFQGFGSIGSAIMLALLATIPDCTRPGWAVLFLGLYGFFFSMGICGFFTSLLCIAPQHTGTLSSMSMTFGNIANISGPLILGLISRSSGPAAFSIVFGLGAIANILSGIFFVISGSADVQEWAKVEKPTPVPSLSEIEARKLALRDRTISEMSNAEF